MMHTRPNLKVLTVLGTRPEGIKVAPIIRELARRRDRVTSLVCSTAQHRDLLDQVLRVFQIRPDYDLDVMRANQTLAGVAVAVLQGLEPILRAERPDWVLVQGDTTTVAAAALAGAYAGARVGHVEAGLRTGDKRQPFPEELNRRVAGVIADLHFAPTTQARDNLLREDVPADQVLVTGNPGIDALRWITAQPSPHAVRQLLAEWRVHDGPGGRRLIYVTAHRRENFGQPLRDICGALRELAAGLAGDIHIMYPVHPNPNVSGPVRQLLGDVPHITLSPPLDYASNLHLLRHAALVLTDSGGLQEEATSLGVPVLVLREVTERMEGVHTGALRLVGTDARTIVRHARRLLEDPQEYARMARAVNPFGDGRAAERIVSALLGEPVTEWQSPPHQAELAA
jgi:UDP-N-acetylglucosamine 2-epimerase (non-hydrolysing)